MSEERNEIEIADAPITLADMVEQYMLEKQIFNEKYYQSYLKYAQNAWEELFYDTLYIYNGRWLKVKNVNGKYIVNFPKDYKSFISANMEVPHSPRLQRIPYDSSVSVIEKPSSSIVNCQAVVDSFITTTKYMFTSANVDYYQTTYLKYCPNGDIIERIDTPTKKYEDNIGDIPGDYGDDYNDDYSHEAFGNFTITTISSQRVLCNLDTDENGCPKNTIENISALTDNCLCYSHYLQHTQKMPTLVALGENEFGSVTVMENQRGLVYNPSKHCPIPDEIMVYFKGRASGNVVTGAAIIPDDFFINRCMILGIESYALELNNSFNDRQKTYARAQFDNAINNLVRDKMFRSLDVFIKASQIKVTW